MDGKNIKIEKNLKIIISSLIYNLIIYFHIIILVFLKNKYFYIKECFCIMYYNNKKI